MCGILGIVGTKQPERPSFVRALRTMAARGPDDEGVLHEDGLSFGHRRLAIIDLSPAGHQPMFSADKRYAIVYNGEVYNFRALAEELKSAGVALRSSSDTEVILELYAREGSSCLAKLRGMFALAIWDRQERCLFLARDQQGIKPLYYMIDGDTLSFASEIRALRTLPRGPTEISRVAVANYLSWGSVPGPGTIMEGVQSLAPGSFATFRDSQLTQQQFWSFPVSEPEFTTHDEAVEVLRPALAEAVALRCVSDVPVAAFLSGGIDSSAIVMLMRAAGQSQLRTFSLGFPGTALDESRHAAEIARIFKTEHTNVDVHDHMVEQSLDGFFAAMDQPTGDGLNTYLVSKFAKQSGLTVALSGLGGDELFGGYPSFRRAERAATLLAHTPRGVLRVLTAATGHAPGRFAKLELLAGPGSSHARLYALTRGVFPPTHVAALLGRASAPIAHYEPAPGASPFHAAMQLELEHYTHDQLLRDSDVYGMAHSLEIRVPFIDDRLTEVVARVSPHLLLAGFKGLLCDAMPRPLPRECTERKKMGFTFPFDRWLRTTWRARVEATLLGSSSHGLLEPAAVARVWRTFLAGRAHWSRPWALYALMRCLEGLRQSPPSLDATGTSG